jgi:Protein of unknown function (DUF3634)
VDLAFNLILVAALVAVAWLVLQARFVFVIRITRGMARRAKGRVTAEFVDAVSDTCADLGISNGWVGGVRRGRRIVLTFSFGMPPRCRQRLRNIWVAQR